VLVAEAEHRRAWGCRQGNSQVTSTLSPRATPTTAFATAPVAAAAATAASPRPLREGPAPQGGPRPQARRGEPEVSDTGGRPSKTQPQQHRHGMEGEGRGSAWGLEAEVRRAKGGLCAHQWDGEECLPGTPTQLQQGGRHDRQASDMTLLYHPNPTRIPAAVGASNYCSPSRRKLGSTAPTHQLPELLQPAGKPSCAPSSAQTGRRASSTARIGSGRTPSPRALSRLRQHMYGGHRQGAEGGCSQQGRCSRRG
jgi:hypothetical protein